MKKLKLIALLLLITVFGYSQKFDKIEYLRVDSLLHSGSLSSPDTMIVPDLDNPGLHKYMNATDPINGSDVVSLQYLENNALLLGVPIDSLLFSTDISNLTWDEGKLYYDSIDGSLIFHNEESDIALSIGFESWIQVKNNTSNPITNGSVVYPTGVEDGKVTIGLADAKERRKSTLVGVVTHDIGIGEIGYVTKSGEVKELNTDTYDPDLLLYLSPDIPGTLTNTRPDNGEFAVIIGAVKTIDNDSGSIIVDIVPSEITTEINAVRGWSDPTNTIIFPTSFNRTMKVIPASGNSFYNYQDGLKTISDGDTLIWDGIEGTHDFYYLDGVLTDGINLTEAQVRDIYTNYPGIGRMYWDAVNDTIIYINDMRHTFDQNGNTWAALWDFHKCQILEGLDIVDIQTEGSGNVDADAQFGHDSGLIRNQDILTSIPAIASTTGYTIFYRDGVSAWRSDTNPGFPVLTTGTGRVAWNEESGGSWSLTEATNNTYVLAHLLVSNTLGIKSGIIVGQNNYSSITNARVGARSELGELLLSPLPIKEFAAIATVIFQTADNYTNAVQAKTRLAEDAFGNLVDYIDWRFQIFGGGGTGGGTGTFLGMTDTPGTYAGAANKLTQVGSGELGLEFTDGLTHNQTSGLLTVQNQSGTDTDNLIEGKNNAGTTTFELDGNGDLDIEGDYKQNGTIIVQDLLSTLTNVTGAQSIAIPSDAFSDDVILEWVSGATVIVDIGTTVSGNELFDNIILSSVSDVRPFEINSSGTLYFTISGGNINIQETYKQF